MKCACTSKDLYFFNEWELSANEALNAASLVNLNVKPPSRLLCLFIPPLEAFLPKTTGF